MALSRQISYLQATSETAKDAYLANKCPLEDTKLREEWKKLVESQNRLLVAWQALAINMPAGAGEPPYRPQPAGQHLHVKGRMRSCYSVPQCDCAN